MPEVLWMLFLLESIFSASFSEFLLSTQVLIIHLLITPCIGLTACCSPGLKDLYCSTFQPISKSDREQERHLNKWHLTIKNRSLFPPCSPRTSAGLSQELNQDPSGLLSKQNNCVCVNRVKILLPVIFELLLHYSKLG